MKLFVILVCAHVLADFLLQPDSLVKNKHCFRMLALHAAIQALLAWILVGQWLLWPLPLLVLFSHFLIDFLKQKSGRDTACAFAADQIIHLAVLAALAFLFRRMGFAEKTGRFYQPLVLVSGLVATVQGSGFFVAKVTRRLIRENNLIIEGLKNGGKRIGQLERTLIFLLVFIGQPAGIGFLIAAKSVLRFEETKKQQLAEYVLIGTLLSFSLALALSALTLRAMDL